MDLRISLDAELGLGWPERLHEIFGDLTFKGLVARRSFATTLRHDRLIVFLQVSSIAIGPGQAGATQSTRCLGECQKSGVSSARRAGFLKARSPWRWGFCTSRVPLPLQELESSQPPAGNFFGGSSSMKRSNHEPDINYRGTFPHSFQGSFFLENLRIPRENGRFLERTMVEKNGQGINP